MRKVRKAIIPVAGFGTRFLPITKAVPKEMLPIVDIPTIEYIVKEAVDSGIEEILFVTNPYKKSIEDYFDHHYELEAKLKENHKDKQLECILKPINMATYTFIRQGSPLGTGHAIKICKNFVQDEPFAILYGDDIIDSSVPCLKQMINMYEKYDCNVLCAQKLSDEEIPSKGIIEYEDNDELYIKRLVEKPKLDDAPSKFGTIGRYILKPEIFDELDKIEIKNGEYLLTDAFERLMKYQKFAACKLDGTYYDIGNQLGYLKCNIDFSLKRDNIREGLKDYLNNKDI